jgi:hypothetical protein
LRRVYSEIAKPDFQVVPNVANLRQALAAAINGLPRSGGAMLYFPPGTYRFGGGDEPAISLSGIDDLTISAEGATFLFEGAARPILAQKCRRLQLRGFSIDWVRPPFSQGEVTAVSSDFLTADIRIDPEFPVDGSEGFSALGTYDRGSRLVARRGLDAYGATSSVSMIGEQLLRLNFKRQLRLSAGDTVVLRHAVPGYDHAIVLLDCERVYIDSVKVHASCSMALVGGRCRDVRINSFEVTQTPGSSRLMSTNVDAIHLGNSSGFVDIRDCVFTGMGDDGINVHAQFLELVDQVNPRTVRVRKKAGDAFNKLDLPRKGDRFLISRGNTLEPIGEAVVLGAETGLEETLHFERDLPANLGPGDMFCDANDLPTLRVTNCRFPGNRARGVLAHSDVEISNCQFFGQSDEAVLLTPDLNWMECGSAERVKIHGNLFQDTNRLERGVQGAITVDALTRSKGAAPLSDAINRDILIQANTFAACNKAGIHAKAVDRLTVRGNHFHGTRGPAVELGSVRRVEIAGNEANPASVVTVPQAYHDEVSLDANSGLTL